MGSVDYTSEEWLKAVMDRVKEIKGAPYNYYAASCYAVVSTASTQAATTPFTEKEFIEQMTNFYTSLPKGGLDMLKPTTVSKGCAHEYVNVGFNTINMCCKHCGEDQWVD